MTVLILTVLSHKKNHCVRKIKYTQYMKKRNTYIFGDNSSNFKDVHFNLAGYIDQYVYH